MATSANNTSKSNRKSINLRVERTEGKPFYVNADGVKEGMRGKLQSPGTILASMGKGTARKLRKSLRKAGYSSFAAAPRLMNPEN